MKVLILLMCLFSMSSYGVVEKFVTRIHGVSLGNGPETEMFIKFENARIAFITEMAQIPSSLTKEWIEVELDENLDLLSIHILEQQPEEILVNPPFVTDVVYSPTIFKSKINLQDLIEAQKESFCPDSKSYARAHIWAYEEFQRSQVYSMKAFLFLSDAYIRTTRPKWWFHVAPYVIYETKMAQEEKILDRAMALHPLSMEEWINVLAPNCELHCELIKSSMYYRHPMDLIMTHETGIPRVNFYDWEVESSYQDGFINSKP